MIEGLDHLEGAAEVEEVEVEEGATFAGII